MKTSRTIANKATYLMLATGLVAAPVAAFAQQKAVDDYNQYLRTRDTPAQVGNENPSLRSAIERLNMRVGRLESQYEKFASNRAEPAQGSVAADTDKRDKVSVNHSPY